MINEVRSTSLSKIGKMNFIDAVSDWPVESFRLFVQKIRENDLHVVSADVQEIISDLDPNNYTNRLGPKDLWFSETSPHLVPLHIKSKETGEEIDIKLRVHKNKLHVGYEMDISSREFSITINKSANKVFEELVSIIYRLLTEVKNVRLTNWSKEERKKEREKIFNIVGIKSENNNLENTLSRIANKFKLEIQIYESSVKIFPSYSAFGIQQELKDKIPYNIRDNINTFTYKFQYQQLKKLFPYVVRKIRNNNLSMIEGPRWGNGFVWVKVKSINRDKQIGDKTVAEREEKQLQKFYDELNEKIEKESGTFEEFQKIVIRGILKE